LTVSPQEDASPTSITHVPLAAKVRFISSIALLGDTIGDAMHASHVVARQQIRGACFTYGTDLAVLEDSPGLG